MALLFKNLLFTVLVPGTVGVYVPLWITQGRAVGSGFPFAAACVLLVLGLSIYVSTVWSFAAYGRGTPAPIDAPRKLVVRGLYRFSRNPMYVGVLTVIVGWASLFRAPVLLLYAGGVGCCFQGFIVFYEEPHLAGLFGSQYADYREKVPRWLLRLSPRRSAAA